MKLLLSIVCCLLFLNFTTTKDVIDAKLYSHALHCPKKYEKDLNQLVAYLQQPAINESQVVEVFFYWITENIEYDVEAFWGNSDNNQSNVPFFLRKALCQGYSELLKEMCDLVPIKCYIISGYCKVNFSDIPKTYHQSDHA